MTPRTAPTARSTSRAARFGRHQAQPVTAQQKLRCQQPDIDGRAGTGRARQRFACSAAAAAMPERSEQGASMAAHASSLRRRLWALLNPVLTLLFETIPSSNNILVVVLRKVTVNVLALYALVLMSSVPLWPADVANANAGGGVSAGQLRSILPVRQGRRVAESFYTRPGAVHYDPNYGAHVCGLSRARADPWAPCGLETHEGGGRHEGRWRQGNCPLVHTWRCPSHVDCCSQIL